MSSGVVVVIPARNAAHQIGNQLRALDRQTDLDFAIVVSVNGSDDGTTDVCHSWRTRAQGGLQVIDSSQQPGVSHARNVAIQATTQPLILICDADDRVHPDWVATMRAGLRDFDGVTGPLFACWTDDPTRFEARQATDLPRCEGMPYLSGGNQGFHRRMFEELGGFDESLVLGQEDVDFGWRAAWAGFELAHCAASVDYFQPDSWFQQYRKQFRYGRGVAELVRKHGLRPPNWRTLLRWFWEWAKQYPQHPDPQAALAAASFQLGRSYQGLRNARGRNDGIGRQAKPE